MRLHIRYNFLDKMRDAVTKTTKKSARMNRSDGHKGHKGILPRRHGIHGRIDAFLRVNPCLRGNKFIIRITGKYLNPHKFNRCSYGFFLQLMRTTHFVLNLILSIIICRNQTNSSLLKIK